MSRDSRQVLPSLSELLDRLAINQLKILLKPENESSYTGESRKIERDIDLMIETNQVSRGANLVRLVIALAQINLHIWHEKELMGDKDGATPEHLKLAHQLNGLRNQIKNLITGMESSSGVPGAKTNTETDGLEGWDLSVLERREDPQ